jgi:hypothetical protein
MCLDLINELDKFEDKEKIIKNIQNYQDKKTGCFMDKTAIPKYNASHDQEYILLQLTDFAQLALSALNEKPQYEYLFLEKYKDKKYLEQWYCGLNWKKPWFVSNLIMFILNSFIYENKDENEQYINLIIDLLNKTQDHQNGYWNLGNDVTLHNQMAGAYHFLFFYTFLDIMPNYISEIIDSTLKIQNYDGLFNYESGGGSCDDLDAIDLLCRSTFYSDHRIEEVQNALQVAYLSLLKNQNLDGGFCWAKRNELNLCDITHLINFKLLYSKKDFISNAISKAKKIRYTLSRKDVYWNYSGLDTMKLKVEESDLFSTWFRLTSIAFIESTFPQIYEKSFHWKLRKKCGLGFYNK